MASSCKSTHADNSCPLLELPGELRNFIYAYVLSEPAGLRFRQDEYGIGRLESMPAEKTLRPTLMVAKGEIDDADKKEQLQTAASRVANQLQYVSHEIRRETRGLGVRHNALTFDYLHDILAFINTCPQSDLKHLRLLRLRKALYSTTGGEDGITLGQPDERYAKLFDFCANNPSLVVRNNISGWKQSHPMFVPYAILVEMQFRKSHTRIADFFTKPSIQSEVQTVTSRKVEPMAEALPPNFEIFPEDDDFNERQFRDTCTSDVMINNFFHTAVDGGVQRWADEARKIYEHGI